jgi:hypothetical protein
MKRPPAFAELLVAAGVVSVAVVLIGYIVRLEPAGRRSGAELTHEVYAPQLQAYPPPGPSPTPYPLCGWYSVPTWLTDVEEVTLAASPDADFLVPLQAALDKGDATALTSMAWRGLGVTVSDDCPRVVYEDELRDALDILFDAGSCPRIQGYYRFSDSKTRRSLTLFVSGWQGTVRWPDWTPEPEEITPCDRWPVGTVPWELGQSGDGEWVWSFWGPRGGYSALVRYYSHDGHGTYYALRP